MELDRVVPPSGNLWISGQQDWLGPVLAGRSLRRAVMTVRSGQVEDLQQVTQIGDREVGRTIQVGLRPLIGIEHHGLHAGLPRSEDVPVHVVADVHRVLGRHAHPSSASG